MNSAIEEAIVGEPVTVTLGGSEYPIAFPVQAVILYQAATAKLDRHRREIKLRAGQKRLTREETLNLRKQRRDLLAESYKFVPEGKEAWEREDFEQFTLIQEEATEVKRTLDEDRAQGDSLYDRFNWNKISPEEDPERFLLALWVGLHYFPDPAKDDYLPRLSRAEIGTHIHVGNAEDLGLAIAKALTINIIPPASETEKEIAELQTPNPQPPAVLEMTSPAETTTTMTMTETSANPSTQE